VWFQGQTAAADWEEARFTPRTCVSIQEGGSELRLAKANPTSGPFGLLAPGSSSRSVRINQSICTVKIDERMI